MRAIILEVVILIPLLLLRYFKDASLKLKYSIYFFSLIATLIILNTEYLNNFLYHSVNQSQKGDNTREEMKQDRRKLNIDDFLIGLRRVLFFLFLVSVIGATIFSVLNLINNKNIDHLAFVFYFLFFDVILAFLWFVALPIKKSILLD